jgi:dipeptidyl-peptidase 4
MGPAPLCRRSAFFFSLFLLLAARQASGQEKHPLTFDQIYRNAEPRVTTSLPMVTGWADDHRYLEMRRPHGDVKGGLFAVDVASGKEERYRDLSAFGDLVGSDITVDQPAAASEDNTMLVYERENDLYLLKTETKEFKRLTNSPAEEKNPTLSPDARYVAFTRDNDLYAVELASGKETRFTHDGSDVVYNGWASWLYYEEILGRPSHYRAFWWSPDGASIAFFRFDDSQVPVFPIFRAEGTHGSLEKEHYPKSGDPNPEVRVGIASVKGGAVTWADFNPKKDQYFGQPFWTPDSKSLWVQWMNRGQDTLIIYAVNPSKGTIAPTYSEHQSTWVDWLEDLTFLKNSTEVILHTDKDGWMHYYLVDRKGKLVRRLTEGKWTAGDLSAVDEEKGYIYITGKKEASTRTDLYRVKLADASIERVTFGPFTHSVKVSPNGKFFTTQYSNVATPPRLALYDGTGKLVRELGDSKTPALEQTLLGKTEMFTIHTPDGYDLPAVWILPPDFDPAKRYPVLISIYGGPNAGMVTDSWKGISQQWMAHEGLIQLAVDHRGSGHFGKEGVGLMYRCLGKWEMNDYGEVVKWLHQQTFVDTTHVGITGGSYGGYVTCLALTRGADLFNYGLALFSVTDWTLYDSHYVERYMDTPAENPDGYRDGSVLTYADKYKGLLRIVHGTIDDNVHMQNSIQLIDKLEDLNKHFEVMIYPGERHGWGGPKALHLRNETLRFEYQYLLNKEFPSALFEGVGLGAGRPH